MEEKRTFQPQFKQVTAMALMTIFQLLCAAQVMSGEENLSLSLVYIFFGYIAAEWIFMLVGNLIAGNDYFELEVMAFFLSGIGLTICASISENYALKQLIAIGIGIVAYIVVLLLITNVNVASFLRYPAAVCSVLILAANLLLAKVTNGALNWITIGPLSIQPSEIVKVAFILVGSVSLDKLLSNTSLTKYIIFSVVCIGFLFLMRDFGTALIFFFTFILIAFMRSGDMRTIIFICTAALLGAVLIIYFKPYVANRFAAYRHVWENMDTTGYQQTRVLIYSASGGLLGLGIGNGKLRNVFAASTDLVFGMVCEEFGLIIGIAVILAFAFIAVFAVRAAQTSGSTFYSIAAVSAAGMILFQLALNVFGITDILPLTGVTLPFVSRGGSSIICSWGLIAYIKAAGMPFTAPMPDIGMSKVKKAKPDITMSQKKSE